MPIRSNVDLCLYVRFIHVLSGNLAPGVERLLENGAQRDAWIQQFSHDLGVTFHEAYHYWQGLRLPFLHRYALLSLRTVLHAFRELDKISDLHSWDCMLPELHRLTLPSRWHCPASGQVSVQPLSQGAGDGLDLTPLDLLEGAASLAQWQTVVARGSERWAWSHFSRWSKRNPCYTKALVAVAEAIGDNALALRCFIPMVNTAFHTSEPVLTLGYLACLLSRPEAATWRSHAEPCNWRELFQNGLSMIPFKAQPDCDVKILGSPYHRITVNWLGTKPPHPMLTEMAAKWHRLEENDYRYKLVLDQPGYLDGDFVAEVLRDFAPFTIMCFHLRSGQTRVVVAPAGDVGEGDHVLHGYLWLQALSLYSVVRRAAGAHFDPELRLCYHQECPEYLLNYCNAFPRIPSNFSDCTFRKTVAEIRERMRRSIDDKGR
jgi:hypothetical protein